MSLISYLLLLCTSQELRGDTKRKDVDGAHRRARHGNSSSSTRNSPAVKTRDRYRYRFMGDDRLGSQDELRVYDLRSTRATHNLRPQRSERSLYTNPHYSVRCTRSQKNTRRKHQHSNDNKVLKNANTKNQSDQVLVNNRSGRDQVRTSRISKRKKNKSCPLCF